MADFIVGNTRSKLRRQIIDATTNAPLSLVDVTVNLLYRINGGLQVRVMDIIAPAINGVVEYQWVPGDLEAGIMEADIQIISTDLIRNGQILTTTDPIKLIIRSEIN